MTRSVTDMVVPGAVIPFTYTRIWNSRSRGWSTNWSWGLVERDQTDLPPGGGQNDYFIGYEVHYPDGRVVQFNKPTAHGPPAAPGTYPTVPGVVDRLTVLSGGTQAQLLQSDGSVVNFPVPIAFSGNTTYASSVVDPHGLTTALAYTGSILSKITEPGGRWISIGATQGSGTNHQVTVVTSSLGQTVTYTTDYGTTGYTWGPQGGANPPPPNWDNVLTVNGTVTYNDVLDDSGQPVQAQYVYKWVQPPNLHPPAPPPSSFYRLYWASDPMFNGPLQQVKYVYVDYPPSDYPNYSTADPDLTAILEERSAATPASADTGILVNRVEMLPNTYDPNTGYSKPYWQRKQTRGDGLTRTISYYNNDTGRGQNLVDNLTDWKNNASIFERRKYDWTHYFQTPTQIIDMKGYLTQQSLESVCGHITRETHPDTYHRDWSYTDPNNPYYVGTATDERLHTTTFTRDPTTHRVTRVDYPNTTSQAGLYPQTSFETFAYTPLGQIKTHQLTNGGTESFVYYPGNDSVVSRRNCLQSWTNADGKTTLYDYDSLGRVSTVTDPRGASLGDPSYTTNYAYNGRHQVTKITLPPDRVTGQRYTIQKSYNAQTGTLASVSDELGHVTSYGYDGYDRVISVKDATGQTTTTNYGPWNNGVMRDWHILTTNTPTQTISPMGKTVNIYYEENLRKSATLQAPNTADAAWTWFDYDDNGNLTKVTDGRAATLWDPNHTTTYGYDNRNRKTSQTDPAPFSYVTSWQYDATSNMTKETRPDSKFRTLGYDERNHLIDEYGFTNEHTHYERDPAGNIGQETTCNGGVYKYTYDNLNRKKTCTYPVDATGQTRGEGWVYDAAGNMNQYTNPAGQVKALNYDNRNRVYNSSWSGSSGPTTDTTYDAASRMTSVKTNNGETLVSFGYDDANRQIWEEQTVAGSPMIHIDTLRDFDGNRKGLSVPNYSLLYDYTQRNQLWHIKTGAAANWFTYTYDAAGNMTKRQNVFGGLNDSVNVTPDNMNRVSVWENTGSGDAAFARSHYTYDNLSRETVVGRDEEGLGDVFGYNARNQLTSASYDAATPTPTPPPPTPTPTPTATPPPTPTPTPTPGRVTQPTITPTGSYPSPISVTMRCATSGATIFYTQNGTTPTHSGGTPTGNTSIYSSPITVPKGTARDFWALGYKAGMTDSTVATLLVDDTGSNVAPPGGGGAAAAPAFTLPTQRNVTYAFTTADPLNRDSVTDNGVLTNYTANKLNQYSGVSGQTLSYDNNFNLTAYGGNSYGFDAQNQLTGANGVTVKCIYDGLGRVLKRTINGNATIFVYDGWKAFEELDGSGNRLCYYIYGAAPDEILYRYDQTTGAIFLYHTDKEGNVMFLLDASNGNGLERYTYDAFGAAKIMDWNGNVRSVSAYGNRLMFNGKDYVTEMGLYDYRHRWYQPQLGHFLQVDPKGFDAGDENLFRYCMDDPVDRTDPEGLFGTPLEQSYSGMVEVYGDGVATTSGSRLAGAPLTPTPVGQSGAKGTWTTREGVIVQWRTTGNWNDRSLDNHVVSDNTLGGNTRGLTTSDVKVTTSKESLDVTQNLNWYVEAKYKNTDVVTRELQHVRRWLSWQRDGDGGDVVRAFARTGSGGVDGQRRLQGLLDASHSRNWIEQKADYHDNGLHSLDKHPAIPLTREQIDTELNSIQ